MLRIVRAAFATIALFLLPQFASAGPIQWGYHAETPDGTVLANVTGLTALSYDAVILPHPLLGGVLVPTQDQFHEIWRSEATVRITDELSGQFADIPFVLELNREYDIKADGSRELIGENLEWRQPETHLLGENYYSIYQTAGGLHAEIIPLALPEPGTFALAALGMCGLGIVRRIRRP